MRVKHAYHARSHLPGGSDPIAQLSTVGTSPFGYISGANGTHPGTGTDIVSHSLFIDLSDNGSLEPIGGVSAYAFGCINAGTTDETYFTRDYVTPSAHTYKYYALNVRKAGTYEVDLQMFCYEDTLSFDPRVVQVSCNVGYLDYDSGWASNTAKFAAYGERITGRQTWYVTVKDILILNDDTPTWTIPRIVNTTGNELTYYCSLLIKRIGDAKGNGTDDGDWFVSGESV